ncbi:MAG: tRNA (adenosine(37)-N6)-dimethylallyltransferase MiaA [Brevinematia bacterium]
MEVFCIVGPTSSGKSYIAHNVARKLIEFGVGTEIISCDSVQVYKYFDIGSAKVSIELRKEVPYHLIDIFEPNEGVFSAGDFRKRFDEIVWKLVSSNKIAILVGGTGLYYKAVKVGIFEGPSANKNIRENLYRKVEKDGVESLYSYLYHIDPEYASKISKNDTRRIIRAIEVYEITGKKFSELHKISTKKSPFKIYSFFIFPNRSELYSAINHRVYKMIKEGFVDEVKWIISNYGKNIYPLNSIGYKEVRDYLDGKLGYNDMIELIKKNTRNFAKRQITLFKHTSVDETIIIDTINPKNLDIFAEIIFEKIISLIGK